MAAVYPNGTGETMIEIHVWPLEGTRTKERSCVWHAEAGICGKTYVATSRAGVTHEMARTLVNAGIPDAKMHVYTQGLRGYMIVPSIERWAEWTYVGGERVRYDKAQASLERLRQRSP